MPFKNIFVTVGTTEFNKLIEKIHSKSFLNTLKSLGCKELVIQYGNGSDLDFEELEMAGIYVDAYRLKPNIGQDIKNADLVISHAGAGTCTEVLKMGKPLVVVINEDLMNNHQTELAEKLYDGGHLFFCSTETLDSVLINSNFKELKPYPKGDMSSFINQLDILMGFAMYHEE